MNSSWFVEVQNSGRVKFEALLDMAFQKILDCMLVEEDSFVDYIEVVDCKFQELVVVKKGQIRGAYLVAAF